MSSQGNPAGFRGSLVVGLLIAAFAILVFAGSLQITAQDAQRQQVVRALPPSDTALVMRGRYIVEDLAMCGTCHTPRKPNGELDREHWLAGAPVPYLPVRPTSDWPTVAPRIAGLPPASNAGMITLLTTRVWITGKPLRDPMPHFHMTQADAEAVVAYLRSLTASR